MARNRFGSLAGLCLCLLTPAVGGDFAEGATDPAGSAGTPAAASPGFSDSIAIRLEIAVARGQTLDRILLDRGVSHGEAVTATRALARVADPRRLRAGQALTLFLEPGPRAGHRLTGLALALRGGDSAVVFRDFGDRFSARRMPRAEAVAMLNSILVVADDDAPGFMTRDMTLRRGGTVAWLLAGSGAARADVTAATRLLGRLVDLRRLPVGQTVTAIFDRPDAGKAARLIGVALTARDGNTHTVGRRADGRWRVGPPDVDGESGDEEPAAPQAVPETAEAVSETPPLPDSAAQAIRRFAFARGDSLSRLLARTGIPAADSRAAAHRLSELLDLRRIRPGHELAVGIDRPGGKPRLRTLALDAGRSGAFLLVRGEDGRYRASRAGGDAIERALAAAPAATPPAADAAEAPPEDLSPAMEAMEAATVTRFTVARGDSLSRLLARARVPAADAHHAARVLSRLYHPRHLRAGQELAVGVDRTNGETRLLALALEAGPRGGFLVARGKDGQYRARRAGGDAIRRAFSAGAEGAVAPEAVTLEARIAEIEGGRRAPLAESGAGRATLGRGATFIETLVRAGFARRDAHAAATAAGELHDLSDLRAGAALDHARAAEAPDSASGGAPRLGAVSFEIDKTRRLEAVRLEDGSYVAGFVETALRRALVRADSTVRSSFYVALANAGVPAATIMQAIRIFSYSVDFQRDLRTDDRVSLIYEVFFDDLGARKKTGDILYASMVLSGEPRTLYRHRRAHGGHGYFDSRGRNARKALMRTPIDGAQLSSGFGMRRHPIQGYNKMHKGVDFAAATGTPIYASADGVVEHASRNGFYGRYVRIRHNSQYKTAYAHLSAFARGLRPGKRVRQGETIGYVGSSGRSTGPHLHYEVIYNGRQVNPLSVTLPAGDPLEDSEFAAFEGSRRMLDRLSRDLPLSSPVMTDRLDSLPTVAAGATLAAGPP